MVSPFSEQITRLTHSNRGYIAAIDQGTTSTRCIIFDSRGSIISTSQVEHQQIFPQPGWVEHDPEEIRLNTRRVMALAAANADIDTEDIAALGITNQRETTLVWDRATGEPIYNAIVWQDTRTDSLVHEIPEDIAHRVTEKTGLPVSTYFSALKIRWILDHVDGARERAERGELAFGTIDTWIIWELTRRSRKKVAKTSAKQPDKADKPEKYRVCHVTDVTNASRTMLMDLHTQQWDPELCAAFDIPMSILPDIVSSSEIIDKVRRKGPFNGVPIAGILGDQQAASFGQACIHPGQAKNTYGTGNFLLMNTGQTPQRSNHGLLTTVAYRLGNQPAVYALEGSIAVTGSLVQWLRDNLGIINSSSDIEALARSVENNGGCYVVPAFSGLLAPRWRDDARGVIVGLTRYITKAHIARAALEATAFQTREVVEAMNADSGVELTTLKVDGGMTANSLLMQCQADQLGVDVVVPAVAETTALGAAFAAGLAVGFYSGVEEIEALWQEKTRYSPTASPTERETAYTEWNKAVERTYGWR